MLTGNDVKAAGEAASGLVSGLGDFALKLRSAITGKIDPVTEAKLLEQAARIELSAMQAQAKVNEIEAASPRFFIAGARPAIIWLCGLILFYSYMLIPIIAACGVRLPNIDLGNLWPVLTGLLGISGLRTYEKMKGVQGKH